MSKIFWNFKREDHNKFKTEEFEQLLGKGEVIAFTTQIQMDKKKAVESFKKPVAEAKLTEYIKYLVGEQNNKGFEFRREDFSQRHELNKQSLKKAFDEYATQERDSMKTVANDIIERVDYRQVVK